MGSLHQPVLVDEVVAWLTPQEGTGSIIVDGTAGGGGHAVALARRLGAGGRLIGLDRDPAMLDLAEKAVKASGFAAAGDPGPRGVSRDAPRARRAGDRPGAGSAPGPGALVGPACLGRPGLQLLDRRAARHAVRPRRARPDAPPTWSTKCGRPIWPSCSLNWGRNGSAGGSPAGLWKTAKRRPIQTTGQLAELVRRSVPGRARHGPIDPATRVFQALRIAVNDELGQLDAALEAIPELLAPGGRAAIISFHSLEDRRVKWAFKTNSRLTVLTKKPVTATAQELAVNPRARSAKLRVVERCPNPS